MEKERFARPLPEPAGEQWTRVDQYFAALARRRTARRARDKRRPRSEPDDPRFSLSTLPFLVLFAALAVIATVIIVSAWPGAQPPPRARPLAHELGWAPKGWYQEAGREMHR